jgi:hypothetical protein
MIKREKASEIYTDYKVAKTRTLNGLAFQTFERQVYDEKVQVEGHSEDDYIDRASFVVSQRLVAGPSNVIEVTQPELEAAKVSRKS